MGISYTHAQTMKKLIHTQDFENRLAKEAQTMQSIESDFTQVKYLDPLFRLEEEHRGATAEEQKVL